MDQQIVSKETLINGIREAITHVNRNLYEWTRGIKKGKIQLTFSHSEITGLARNWIVRLLRGVIGYREADMIFRGMVVNVDSEEAYISGIFLSSSGEYYKIYNTVAEVLRFMNYESLKYNPNDYKELGYSEKKLEFDPFFFVSFSAIDSIKF
jgi:hypothetical protein